MMLSLSTFSKGTGMRSKLQRRPVDISAAISLAGKSDSLGSKKTRWSVHVTGVSKLRLQDRPRMTLESLHYIILDRSSPLCHQSSSHTSTSIHIICDLHSTYRTHNHLYFSTSNPLIASKTKLNRDRYHHVSPHPDHSPPRSVNLSPSLSNSIHHKGARRNLTDGRGPAATDKELPRKGPRPLFQSPQCWQHEQDRHGCRYWSRRSTSLWRRHEAAD